jgi:hypothetical protein
MNRMMKNAIASSFISAILLSTSFTDNALGAPIPSVGGKCTKVKVIATIKANKKNFICTQSGKKLLWVAYKPPVVKPKALTPSPTPSPQTTETKNSETATQNRDKPTPQPTPKTSASPTSKPSSSPSPSPSSSPTESTQGASGASSAPAPSSASTEVIQSSYSPSDSNIDTCRIPDQRPPTSSNGAVAYPAEASGDYKNTGVTNIVVLPVDFSDAPGTGKPSAYYQGELDKASAWINRYSNGKASYHFITNDEWIRAKGPSKDYNVIHFDQGGTNVGEHTAAVIQEYMDTAGNKYSYKDAAAIWVFYSPNQKEILHSLDLQGGIGLKAPDGSVIHVGQYSTSVTVSNSKNEPLWGWFVHEMLHGHGLRGHSPIYPYMFGMMALGGQEASSALESWNQLILDWLPSSRVYCTDIASLKNSTIPIVAKGTDSAGIESVMIKISSHQVLVLELNKKSTWSPGLRKDFAGVMAYLVDTQKDTTQASMQESNFNTTSGTANYLSMPGINHGKYKTDGTDAGQGGAIVDGIFYGRGNMDWNENLVLFAGEQTKIQGINLLYKTNQSGDFVVISKA